MILFIYIENCYLISKRIFLIKMNNYNNSLDNIDYGIKEIFRLGKGNENEDKTGNNITKELRALELKDGASIVKIESFATTRVILLCIQAKYQYFIGEI